MAFNKFFFIRLIFALFAIWLILILFDSFLNRRIREIVSLQNWHEDDELYKRGKETTRSFFIRQNGKYWILYNYVRSRSEFHGNESITYTTHGEYTFLDNLEAVITRWRAPISIALYSCGSDFEATLNSIRYLRSCSAAADLIKDLVTFHIFFHEDHMPGFVPKTEDEILKSIDCSQLTSIFELSKQKPLTYRAKEELLYPINVARNIARHEATTYYVFPLDIELLPSVNFVREFLEMVGLMKLAKKRSVFAVAIFEMQIGYDLPSSKTELQKMLHNEIAIPFHLDFALTNHAIPELEEWIKRKEPKHMKVFKVVSRTSDGWEPFYVTINGEEPYFDEHFSWEGQYDKRIQADLLSTMNYDFIILDKAFLMHRPGIKVYQEPDPKSKALRIMMNDKAHNLYRSQLWKLYGGTKFKANQGDFEEDYEEIIEKFPYQQEEVIKTNVTYENNAELVQEIVDNLRVLPDSNSKGRTFEKRPMFEENIEVE